MIRYSVSFTKDIDKLLGRTLELGLEGLIAKRSGSRYEARQCSGAWIKLVIGGYTEPEGSRNSSVARDWHVQHIAFFH